MAPPTGKCRKCAEPADLKCSRCNEVFYCCKEHQKLDWREHKKFCRDSSFDFKVSVSDLLGHHVVAARDFKANDVIVSELPLAIGPSHRKRPKKFCIGCYLRDVYFSDPANPEKCLKCGWMACHWDCPGLVDLSRHANECAVLKRGVLPSGDMCKPTQILPIRCMLLQKRNPKMWKILKELGERALKERDPKLYNDSYSKFFESVDVGSVVKKVLPHVEDASVKTVEAIFALLDWNGIWLREPADEYLVAIYPTASILQHNCLPNTALFFQEQPDRCCCERKVFLGQVTIKAIRDIKKGEILTTIRGIGEVFSSLSTVVRQQELLQIRGLRCKCARCLDPTELGLHTGTIKCVKCPGWVLPVDTGKIEESHWKCNGSCGRRLKAEKVKDLHMMLNFELGEKMEANNERQLSELLKKFEIYLHPKHQLNINLKGALAYFYGKGFTKQGTHESDMRAFSAAELQEKGEYCKDIVSCLEVIGPTTTTLAEFYAECLLQATRIDIEFLKRKFEAGCLTPEAAAISVVEYRAKLRQILVIMNNKVNTHLVGQAAFDDRGLIYWAKRKNLKLVTS